MRNPSFTGATLLIVCSLSVPAYSQQTLPAQEAVPLGPVTVNARVGRVGKGILQADADEASAATRTATPLIETPQAISVVDAAEMQRRGDRSVAAALNHTAGVRSQSVGSDTRIDRFQLRGFDNDSFVKNGLVLVDSGAFLAWSTPVEAIERLEVLKGPSSVLYGGGSVGGLVEIVTKAPLDERVLTLKSTLDEYGSTSTALDSGNALSSAWSYRAVLVERRGGAQAHHGKDDRDYAMGTFNWHPSADTSLTLRGSVTRDRANRPTGFLPYQGAVGPLSNGTHIPIRLFVSDPRVDHYDRDQVETGVDFRQELGDRLELVSTSRYATMDLDYAGLYGLFSGNPLQRDGRYFLNRGNSRQKSTLYNTTSHNHLRATFDSGAVQQTWLAGVDFNRSQLRSDRASGPAPPLDIFNPDYRAPIPPLGPYRRDHQTLTQTGVYLQDQLKAGPWVLVLSGRHDRLDIDSGSTGPDAPPSRPGKNTYRTGLVYVDDSGWAPYLNYASSFSSVIGTQAASGRPYVPESGRQAEAGIRYRPPNLPIALSAATFDIHRTGVLTADPQPGFPSNQSQGGQQRSRGAELQVVAQPSQQLHLDASLTAFHLQVIDGAPTLVGKTPTATPELVSALSVDYSFASGSRWTGLGVGGGARYTGKSYATTDNTLSVSAVTVFDAGLHYAADRYRVALNVDNLFNRRFIAACPSAGTCYVGNLRRATLSFEYNL